MRDLEIVVTGGCGVLGQALIRELVGRGELPGADDVARPISRILAVDRVHHAGLVVADRVEYVRGDIASETLMSHVMSGSTGAVFHLALAPRLCDEDDDGSEHGLERGAGEALDALRTLLAACRLQRRRPRLVYASSFFVFGDRDVVDDASEPSPRSGAGTQQAIAELLLADARRRGLVDARSIRLPIVLPRATGDDGLASFAGRLIGEALGGRAVTCPVGPDATLLLGTEAAAIDSLMQAHRIAAAAWPRCRALNLPALGARIDALIAALAAASGVDAEALVSIEPDPRLDAIVRSWPRSVRADAAQALGFPGAPEDVQGILR